MDREKTLLAVLVLGFVTIPNSFGIVRHNGSSDSDYIRFGNHFTSTVISGYPMENTLYFRASAVVIDPHWVLCSAHQYFDSTGNPLYSGAFIATGSNFIFDRGQVYIADQWFCYPGSTASPDGPDIALLYFKNPVPGVTSAVRFRGILQPGPAVGITGYGRSGTPAAGYFAPDYQRRGCQNRMDRFGDGITYPEFTIFSDFVPPTSPDYDPLGGLAGPGDSGGGWFNQEGLLIGISIEVGALDTSYHNYTIAQDITWFNEWIDTTMSEMNRTRTLDMPDFAGFSACWMSTTGDARFNGAWDLVPDGRINNLDLDIFIDQWLCTQPAP
ncbi:MAG: hypothetical protein ABFD91_12350 [Anaerohalosphaeraceae bacterium]